MDRLVYYSLYLPPDAPRDDLVQQLDASVSSLRAHNRDVAVALFVHGDLTEDLARVCGAYGVLVGASGPYEGRLAALCPQGWPALARYPLLHKFLHFDDLAAAGAVEQVLFCDCDTIFFDDVGMLFDGYGEADLVAREEVHSSRSHYGVDPTFIDEPLLADLAAGEGAALVPPFNLGVVLFNNGLWRRLAPLQSLLVDYAWRFVAWMAVNPVPAEAAAFAEFVGVDEARTLLERGVAARPLPFPSTNRWILDEVALWLTLGHVSNLTTADFDRDDVAQNGEFVDATPADTSCVMCHYYSQNMHRMGAWLSGQPVSIST